MRAETWRQTARPEQLPPSGDWRFWYLRGGRGSGKSRTGAETLAQWIWDYPESEWAVIAPTYGDARDTCMESRKSGLLMVLKGFYDPRKWNRSLGTLELHNGSLVYIDGADDGALRIQGKNLAGAWCDEIGLWRDWRTAWHESLAHAVRFPPARRVCTGTPKVGHPLVRLLLNHPRAAITHMRTIDNAVNLDEAALDALLHEYGGTRLGRQELEGEFLDEPLGALWTLKLINDHRVTAAPELDRIIVGVDPSGSRNEDTGASETGIVIAGLSNHLQHSYVLGDASMHGSPDQWGRQVVAAYYGAHSGGVRADIVVAEKNFGGEMVRTVIQAIDGNVPVQLVTASRGKQPRAEPVAARYEQGRVHHVGEFSRLEEQMASWIPGDSKQDSPDRMDALVWALTELIVAAPTGFQYPTEDFGEEPIVIRGDLRLVGRKYLDQ